MEFHKRRRFTVDEYYRMGAAGILDEDDRVELIEGEILEMSPIGRKHAACVGRSNRRFSRLVGSRAVVRVQDPIRLADDSEPQPDLAIVRARADFYASGHPRPKDVFLLVEVADESVDRDRRVKLPLYARAGVAEVWLVDLNARVIEIHRRPRKGVYREVRSFAPGERLPVAALDATVAVNEILGGE